MNKLQAMTVAGSDWQNLGHPGTTTVPFSPVFGAHGAGDQALWHQWQKIPGDSETWSGWSSISIAGIYQNGTTPNGFLKLTASVGPHPGLSCAKEKP